MFHVAGTNGKGSAIAFLRAIAEAAGFRVHAFTKPHLLHLRERFRVAGKLIDEASLIETAERVATSSNDLTQFDAQVAAAFLLFSATPADFTLLETGMGGGMDSTNAIARPALTLITPIALDHQDVLGASLAEIAAHKAGILKPGIAAVIARQQNEAREVIEAEAARLGAPLFRQGVEWDAFAQAGRLIVQTQTRVLDLPLPGLHGVHQIGNAGLAAAALLYAGVDIPDRAFAAGIAGAHWPGRLQPITSGPLFARAAGAELWVDGGHNPHAAEALALALEAMQARRPARTLAIVGMRARKDWRAFTQILSRRAALVIAIPLGAESANPEAIAAAAREAGAEAMVKANLGEALDQAHGAQRILICGSLSLAGEALRGERFE